MGQKWRKRKGGNGFYGLLSEKEKVIAYLANARFSDFDNEDFRKSLVNQYARLGRLTDKQWYSAFELRRRHKAIKREKDKAGCFVYAVSSGNAIKVGLSADPEKRIKTMQVGNPYKVRLVGKLPCDTRGQAKKLERKIHEDGRKYHIRGEWFREGILDLFGIA